MTSANYPYQNKVVLVEKRRPKMTYSISFDGRRFQGNCWKIFDPHFYILSIWWVKSKMQSIGDTLSYFFLLMSGVTTNCKIFQWQSDVFSWNGQPAIQNWTNITASACSKTYIFPYKICTLAFNSCSSGSRIKTEDELKRAANVAVNRKFQFWHIAPGAGAQ